MRIEPTIMPNTSNIRNDEIKVFFILSFFKHFGQRKSFSFRSFSGANIAEIVLVYQYSFAQSLQIGLPHLAHSLNVSFLGWI